MSWSNLQQELIRRYGTRYSVSAVERLCGVRQTGSLDEYINEFIALATNVLGLPLNHYLTYFMHGLQPHIRASLCTLQPLNVHQAIDLSPLVEADFPTTSGDPSFSSSPSKPPYQLYFHPPSRPPQPPPPLTRPTIMGPRTNRHIPTHRLSNQKYNDLQSKGLCYHCRKPYSPNHNCPAKEFRAIIKDDLDEIGMADFDALTITDCSDVFSLHELHYWDLLPSTASLWCHCGFVCRRHHLSELLLPYEHFGGSCTRHDSLRALKVDRVARELGYGELESVQELNQPLELKRAGKTRSSSHYGIVLNFICMFLSIIDVLEIIKVDGVDENQKEMNDFFCHIK
ncbi:hypothetical protein KSP39_PZI011273 [Platanthera zijinensis]|uniref:Retrotransposon gag domain-containing protein n=1 Tax=Platanthera zijinensis TaxID=2320716 RepID=A0AAP0BGB2_9ASPA